MIQGNMTSDLPSIYVVYWFEPYLWSQQHVQLRYSDRQAAHDHQLDREDLFQSRGFWKAANWRTWRRKPP
jgi:hypothetical protein